MQRTERPVLIRQLGWPAVLFVVLLVVGFLTLSWQQQLTHQEHHDLEHHDKEKQMSTPQMPKGDSTKRQRLASAMAKGTRHATGFWFISLTLVAALGWSGWNTYCYLTQRDQAETALKLSEQRFRDLIEGSIQGILIHQGENILFANQSYAELFGYERPEDLPNLNEASVLIAPHDRERVMAYGRARMAGQEAPSRYEYQGQRRDGTLIWMETQVRMITWDGAPAVQMTVFDLTERNRAEADLRQVHETLEQQVQDRTESLTMINAIADTLYRPLDLNTLAARAVDAIAAYVPAASVALSALETDAPWLYILAARGFPEQVTQTAARLPLDGSLAGSAVTRKTVMTSADLMTDDRIEGQTQRSLVTHGYQTAISIPLLFQDQALGALNLLFQEDYALSDTNRDTFLAVGKAIGLALANAQYLSRLEAEIESRKQAESAPAPQ